jgi:hypothetical protein
MQCNGSFVRRALRNPETSKEIIVDSTVKGAKRESPKLTKHCDRFPI